MDSTIDKHGFRPNVGIVLVQTPPTPESASRVLWARRIGGFNAWQFPQGGIHAGESAQDAVYRELHEEIGLLPDAVTILGQTKTPRQRGHMRLDVLQQTRAVVIPRCWSGTGGAPASLLNPYASSEALCGPSDAQQ